MGDICKSLGRYDEYVDDELRDTIDWCFCKLGDCRIHFIYTKQPHGYEEVL